MFYNMQWHKRGIQSPFASPILTTISGALGLAGAATNYKLLAALNASNAQPLTALKGTAPTQVATSAVVAPFYLSTIAAGTTLQTIPAGYPVVPYSRVTWDTALGAVLGADALNGAGTFDNAGDWSVGANWSVGSGIATATGTTANLAKISALTVGKTYRATYTLVVTGGSLQIRAAASGGTTRNASGTYSDTFVADGATLNIDGVSAFTGTIDNLTVKEITPAYLPTDSAAAALATPTVLSSGLTRYASGPAGNPILSVAAEPSDSLYGRYPRDLSNATYWTASNITPAKNATGTDGVANSASTITASADNGTILQAATLASGARGFFPYVKRKTGTGAVSITLDGGSTWTAVTVTAGWTRVALTQTVTNPSFGFKLATNGDAIEVDYAQVFATAVATSPADNASTSATATRAARYTTVAGSELGSKFNATVSLNEVGREQWILGAAATAGIYVGADNKVNATDGTTTITSTSTVAAGTPFVVGVDWVAGTIALGGTVEATNAAMDTPSYAATCFLGAKIGATNVLNGGVSVVQSSSDAGFVAGALT